jgi:hypothetical protein
MACSTFLQSRPSRLAASPPFPYPTRPPFNSVNPWRLTRLEWILPDAGLQRPEKSPLFQKSMRISQVGFRLGVNRVGLCVAYVMVQKIAINRSSQSLNFKETQSTLASLTHHHATTTTLPKDHRPDVELQDATTHLLDQETRPVGHRSKPTPSLRITRTVPSLLALVIVRHRLKVS